MNSEIFANCRSLAENGNTNAQITVGTTLLYGAPGVERDPAQARLWYRRAADAGNPDAQYKLGYDLGIVSNPEAFTWIQRAAAQGHEEAFKYGKDYARSRSNEPEFRSRYIAFLKDVAERASVNKGVQGEAQLLLANAYKAGEGTTVDLSEALNWYQKAASNGNGKAGWEAVLMVKLGLGRKPDHVLAERMWKDFWRIQIEPTLENNPSNAVSWLKTAANNGFSSAMLRLSQVYSKGEYGEAVNLDSANEWRQRSVVAIAKERAVK